MRFMAGQTSPLMLPRRHRACTCVKKDWQQAHVDTHKKRELVTRFMLKVQSQRMKVTMPHKIRKEQEQVHEKST